MNYTIPQLEGLAAAISEINKDIYSNDDEPITGEQAVIELTGGLV